MALVFGCIIFLQVSICMFCSFSEYRFYLPQGKMPENLIALWLKKALSVCATMDKSDYNRCFRISKIYNKYKLN